MATPSRRSVDARVLASRLADAAESPRYAWFLGAGASKSSGVALAWEILRDAKRELYATMHGQAAASDATVEAWLESEGLLRNPATAYGEALELLLPQRQQRRNWLGRYFEEATPSPGYIGLSELVRRQFVRIALTTNFDDLLRQAVTRNRRQRIREVTHDEAADDFEWPPQLFTLLKLHGDFLYDSIRNTSGELIQLGDQQAEKLSRSATDGGLVVVGYGGGDESVMSVLAALNRVPLGLYWLHLPGQALNGRVEALLANDWAYAVEIEGFDEFVALVSERVVARTRAPAVALGGLPASSSHRFVTGENVQELSALVDAALQSDSERVCVITGLPGVGKTSLTKDAARRHLASFDSSIVLTAQRRALDLTTLLDAALVQLGLPASTDIGVAEVRVLEKLADEPVLLLLDNLDEVGADVAAFLSRFPAPSRVLVTVRDPTGLRAAGVEFREVRHEGLSDEEMSQILRVHASAAPRVAERLRALGNAEVQRLLADMHGWPQALMLVIGQLNDPLADVSRVAATTGRANLVQKLLDEGYDGLDHDARRVLRASTAFHATVTPEGVRWVAAISRARVEQALSTLLERRWLAELGPRTYTYAHPLVEEFVRSLRNPGRETKRSRARAHLERWLERYGGQPDPDWANFRELDREFENVRAALENDLMATAIRQMTDLMQPSFSYCVERGHWSWTDDLARRVLATGASARQRAEWLVWRSWLALYLRQDAADSARLAEEALATGTTRVRPRFEAHRRALTALTQTGAFAEARRHAESAAQLRPKLGRRDSDEAVDLMNALSALDVAEGLATEDPAMIERGLALYRESFTRCSVRGRPNTRELGVALLGQARALHGLGRLPEALETALRAVDDAVAIRWLRGQEEGNQLVAEIAEELGHAELARSARAFAEAQGVALRSSA